MMRELIETCGAKPANDEASKALNEYAPALDPGAVDDGPVDDQQVERLLRRK